MDIQMQTCKYCGKETPAGSVFCCVCGERLARRKREKKTEVRVPKPRQLPSGSWTTRVMVDGERTSVTAGTEEECQAKAAAVKLGLIEAKKQPKAVTLTEAIDRYIAARDLSPETVRGYRRTQKRYKDLMQRNVYGLTADDVRDAIKKERKIYRIPKAKELPRKKWGAEVEAGGEILKISGTTVEEYEAKAQAFKREVLGESLAPKTARDDKALIVEAIKAETGQALDVRIAKGAKQDHLFLDPEQIRVFCAAIRGTDVEIAALLALSSLRRSELIHLDWSGVDLKHRRLQVAGADVYDENNRRVSKAENKTEGSRRVVPIMMDQLQEALKAVGKKEGRVVSCAPDTVRRRVNAICRANGLPEIGTHGLRHSFASLAAHLQMPEAIAMEIGGWQNNKIMREIYVHVWQADKDRYKNEMASFYNLQKPAENGNEFGNDE